MTQLEAARAGRITPEMKFVAQREDLPEELVQSEVARGRMVIPANTVHLSKWCPMANAFVAARRVVPSGWPCPMATSIISTT